MGLGVGWCLTGARFFCPRPGVAQAPRPRQTAAVHDLVTLSERLPRRVVALRLTASDDLPAIPGQRDGERISPLAVLFDPEMRRSNAERLQGQLDGAHAYAGATACGPGADAWEDDETYLQGLPWYRSPSEAIEHAFSVCGEPFDITLFPVLVFDADDSDWREVLDSCRRELARTVDTRLHHAAERGSVDEVRRAIADGWPLDELDPDLNWAPLHHAVNGKQDRILRQLLEAGAEVDAHEPDGGRTALHMAIEENRPAAVRLLLEAGADPDLLDNWQQNADQLAEALGAAGDQVRSLLEEHRRCRA